MSTIFQTHRRKILFAGSAIGFYLLAPHLNIPLPNPFRTPAVKSIEGRYSSGGGAPNHLPATASKRGDRDGGVEGNVDKTRGIGSPHWEEHVAGQKPEGSTFDKAWNTAHYGAEKGK